MHIAKKMVATIFVLALALCVVFPAGAAAGQCVNYGLPEGIYIDLTREFYEALKAEGESGNKTYTNDISQEYLRQIAISSKFMVETNIRILKNQEKIINLLESILKQQTKTSK